MGQCGRALLFAVQAAVAIALLEIINYIEHYGLSARAIGGRYEPVREEHSWNADWVVSNWILFNLQLHSDHHVHMQRPYEALRSVPARHSCRPDIRRWCCSRWCRRCGSR